MQRDDNQLKVLAFDLDLPFFWETDLANKFPDYTFSINKSHPSLDSSCSGLINIEGGSYLPVKEYLTDSGIEIHPFDEQNSLFYYKVLHCPIADIVSRIPCIESTPFRFYKDCKRLKIMLVERFIGEFITQVEKRGIGISNLSKVNANFQFDELLTSKQQSILSDAIDNGYYSYPKKIGLTQFATNLSLSPSTLCVHLQKIENKILTQFQSKE